MNRAHHQYKRGCAVRARHNISTNEDVMYERGTFSVQARMFFFLLNKNGKENYTSP